MSKKSPATMEELATNIAEKEQATSSVRAVLEVEKKIAKGKARPKHVEGNALRKHIDKARQSNKEIQDAVDEASLAMNGWGLGAFEAERIVGALPRGAKRYYVKQECPLVGGTRHRAAIALASGQRYFEVPMAIEQGEHRRPTCHFHNDMCSASWYMGVALVHTTARGIANNDRFHRIMCDKDAALNASGCTVTRLEFATANSMRRKPFGKEGNHQILLNAAADLFSTFSWDSEIFALHYTEICDCLGEGHTERGTPHHMQKIWQISRERLKGACAGSEAKRSRWWSVEVQGREQKPLRGMNNMLLSFVGFRRKWYPDFSSIPLLADAEAALRGTIGPDPAGLEPLAEDPAHEGDAVDAAANGEEGPPVKKLTTQSARAEARKRRETITSQLQYSQRVLSSKRSCMLFDGLVRIAQPLETRFNAELELVKTKKGTLAWQQGLVKGDFYETLQATFLQFCSPVYFEAIGLGGSDKTHAKVIAFRKGIVRKHWIFTYSLVGELALSQLKHEVPRSCPLR